MAQRIWKLNEWRLPCEVPGCGRTMSLTKHPDTTEMVCGKHFRLADKELVALFRRIRKRGEKYGWTRGRWLHGEKVWEKAKQQAIERALGL